MWSTIQSFVEAIGEFLGRTLLALLYFIILSPFGIAVRLFGDPLRLKGTRQTTFWVVREAKEMNLEEAQSQF
jgi:hypothetical protein